MRHTWSSVTRKARELMAMLRCHTLIVDVVSGPHSLVPCSLRMPRTTATTHTRGARDYITYPHGCPSPRHRTASPDPRSSTRHLALALTRNRLYSTALLWCPTWITRLPQLPWSSATGQAVLNSHSVALRSSTLFSKEIETPVLGY